LPFNTITTDELTAFGSNPATMSSAASGALTCKLPGPNGKVPEMFSRHEGPAKGVRMQIPSVPEKYHHK
jgi:hypothetical protein